MPKGVYVRKVKPLAERLWAKVNKNGPMPHPELGQCWVWTGTANGKGYGSIGRGRRSEGDIFVHKASYELAYGAIPEGKWVLHKCDTSLCVRPSHLYAGTPTDNVRDMFARGRANLTGRARGENAPRAKLTTVEVVAIKKALQRGKRGLVTELALTYHVSRSTIKRIKSGKYWSHIKV